jgi:hypothetical protein
MSYFLEYLKGYINCIGLYSVELWIGKDAVVNGRGLFEVTMLSVASTD